MDYPNQQGNGSMRMRNIMDNLALVFTMHKVGSSTVMEALRQIGRVPERGSVDNLDVITPTSKYEAVITPVRDPIARNISYLFEREGERFQVEGYRNEDIFSEMVSLIDYAAPLFWFGEVFSPLFGIDVYEHPFIKDNGWKIINHRYLLIQTEQITEMLPGALWSLFGEEPQSLHRAKTEDTRSYGKLYAEFLDWVSFSDEYLDLMYGHLYVRHFYSEIQIGKMRARWAKK